MKIRTLALLALVSAAGCITFSDAEDAGDDDDAASSPTPICTAPPAIDLDVTLQIQDAEAFDGNIAGARLVLADTVMSCTSALIPASGILDLTLQAFGPIGNIRAELVLSSDASIVHGSGDLTRSFQMGVDGSVFQDDECQPPTDWIVDFSATSDTAGSVTWPLGEGCP